MIKQKEYENRYKELEINYESKEDEKLVKKELKKCEAEMKEAKTKWIELRKKYYDNEKENLNDLAIMDDAEAKFDCLEDEVDTLTLELKLFYFGFETIEEHYNDKEWIGLDPNNQNNYNNEYEIEYEDNEEEITDEELEII